MKQFLKVAIVILLAALLLTGCACTHEWSPATCVTPATCKKCGETMDEARGHKWMDATCTSPRTCDVCLITSGEPAGHEWKDATCLEPKTCSACGLQEGSALGHDWSEATCAVPKTCKRCEEIESELLEHTWNEATCVLPKTCSVCGETEGEALGHTEGKWKTVATATCTEVGSETTVCKVCEAEITREIPLKEHVPGNWEVTVPATKDSKGTHIKKCKKCGTELEKEEFELTEKELKALYIKQCKNVSYTELARRPGEHENEYVKFSGRVVQVCSEASSPFYYSTYRVATSGWDNVVYVCVDNYGSGVRILEDDHITFYGVFDGLYTYETVRGNSLTIPKVIAEYVD